MSSWTAGRQCRARRLIQFLFSATLAQTFNNRCSALTGAAITDPALAEPFIAAGAAVGFLVLFSYRKRTRPPRLWAEGNYPMLGNTKHYKNSGSHNWFFKKIFYALCKCHPERSEGILLYEGEFCFTRSSPRGWLVSFVLKQKAPKVQEMTPLKGRGRLCFHRTGQNTWPAVLSSHRSGILLHWVFILFS